MNDTLFLELKKKQDILDLLIKESKEIKHISTQQKAIALDVELAEFANEVRFFKYWSNKEMNPDKALEEYVDSLHFFLSLANDLMIYELDDIEPETGLKIGSIYAIIKRRILSIYDSVTPKFEWQIAFAYFWKMGQMLGFKEADIKAAYDEKNKVNHLRQNSGY